MLKRPRADFDRLLDRYRRIPAFRPVLLAEGLSLTQVARFDESLIREAILRKVRHGGQIYFEPESKVTYTPSRPAGPGDRAFHLRRWSPDWNNRTLDHFAEKWSLDRRSLRQQWRWLTRHRLAIYRRFGALDPVIRPLVTWREQRKRARLLERN